MQAGQRYNKLPDDTLADPKREALRVIKLPQHVDVPCQWLHDDTSVPDVVLGPMIEMFEKPTEMSKPGRGRVILSTLSLDHAIDVDHLLAIALSDLSRGLGRQDLQGYKGFRPVSTIRVSTLRISKSAHNSTCYSPVVAGEPDRSKRAPS